MTPQQLAKITRRTAEQVISAVPLGPGVEQRTLIAVECAMNEEWWRGYYAGRGVAGSDENPPREEYPDNGPTDPWQTSGPNG